MVEKLYVRTVLRYPHSEVFYNIRKIIIGGEINYRVTFCFSKMSNGKLPFPSTFLWLCFGSLTLQLLLSTPELIQAFSLSPGVVVFQGTENRYPTCNELRRRRSTCSIIIYTIHNYPPFCTNVALQSLSIDDSDRSVDFTISQYLRL